MESENSAISNNMCLEVITW